MKKSFVNLTALTLILGLSACMPKSKSSSSGGSSSSSAVSATATPGNWWQNTPTPYPTLYYTLTPTPTATSTYSPCGDPLGDCTGSYPVINIPISNKRGAQSTEAANVYNSWDSTGLGFTTDGRLRLRLVANSQPDRSSCGVTGSYRWPAYTKQTFVIAVQIGTTDIWSTTTTELTNGASSQIYDVPVSNFPASSYKVVVRAAKNDTTCMWQTAANGAAYCQNSANAAWCGCPVAPDPTNCWSTNLHVVTSSTNNFKP